MRRVVDCSDAPGVDFDELGLNMPTPWENHEPPLRGRPCVAKELGIFKSPLVDTEDLQLLQTNIKQQLVGCDNSSKSARFVKVFVKENK